MDITTDYELECRGDDDFIVWTNGGKYLKCFATLAAAQRYMRRLAREVAAVEEVTKQENHAILDEARRLENRGIAQRVADSKAVYAATRDPRASIRAYCAGNVWATENAKAVGNW